MGDCSGLHLMFRESEGGGGDKVLGVRGKPRFGIEQACLARAGCYTAPEVHPANLTKEWNEQCRTGHTTLGVTLPSAAMEWPRNVIVWPAEQVMVALNFRIVDGWQGIQHNGGSGPREASYGSMLKTRERRANQRAAWARLVKN